MSHLIKTSRSSRLALVLFLCLIFFSTSTLFIPIYKLKQSPLSQKFFMRTAEGENDFITVWDTTLNSTGSSNSSQVSLPLLSGGTYNFTVDWGDGSNNTITSASQEEKTHDYNFAGVYNITINGTISGWQFNNSGDRLKLLEIQQWGCLHLGNLGAYFYGCSNLNLVATDNLNLTGTTNLYSAFKECTNLGSSGYMGGWDVSSVTNMSSMFKGATSFNQNIGAWNVSKVESMNAMFQDAYSFNQPIEGWNVSKVRGMSAMFKNAFLFDQDIGGWNTSSLRRTYEMFLGATSFNQDIGRWNVSSVYDMSYMFYNATSFNQDIGGWDVSSVIDMSYMFAGITLSTENYDNILISWAQLTLQPEVCFHAGNSKYSNAAINARQALITNFNWTIIDGGFESSDPNSRFPMELVFIILIIASMVSLAYLYIQNNKKHNNRKDLGYGVQKKIQKKAKNSQLILQTFSDKEKILKIFDSQEMQGDFSKFDKVRLTTIDPILLRKVDDLDFTESEKIMFLKELRSLSLDKRQELVDFISKTINDYNKGDMEEI